MKGLILAGGKGTRLRPLTINTPKPVVPVANAPFLLYQIDLMRSGGIEEIILSLSYQPRKIEDLLKDGSDYGVWIRYAVEGTPLGTGGAFKNAEEQIDSTTVVFNGDVLTSIDLSAVIARHREKGAVATLVLTPVENPSAYGLVETSADGWVQRFVEKPGPDEITCNTINAGIYVLEPSVLNCSFPRCSSTRSLFCRSSWIATGSISAHPESISKSTRTSLRRNSPRHACPRARWIVRRWRRVRWWTRNRSSIRM
ncbi:MAG: hypothetical protein DMG11_10310 [Acidobacteria bacterium]|nr:MAG: hypothetical protein DMG11_10310 [Acidobacteriota bacterium]